MVAAEAPVRTWRPQPKQAIFFQAEEDEVLYGGAAYGGKSEALLFFCLARLIQYPGSSALIIRQSYTDLSREGALIPRSHEALTGEAKWDGQLHKWTLPNSAVLTFGYLAAPMDRYQYQGVSYETIAWDELTQIEREDDYLFVNAFCRSKIDGCRPLIRATTNPEGVGLGWVKKRFVDIVPPGTTYIDPETGRTRIFIPAKAEDNPAGLARNPGYLANLQGLPDAMREALLHGSWDAFAGQALTEWRYRVHICAPFAIPADWTRWVSIDYGYVHPFDALWFARTPDASRVFVYRELNGTGWRAREQAERILAASVGERISGFVGDPSMWATREGAIGGTLASEYSEAGINLAQANNDRLAGLDKVHKALAWTEEGTTGTVLSPPRAQIFESCTELIRILPLLIHDTIKVEDVKKIDGDDSYDALRYGLMAEDGLRKPASIQPQGLKVVRTPGPSWRDKRVRRP